MKYKRYESAIDKSIIELKKYLIGNLTEKQMMAYAKILNKSYSNGDLKYLINSDKEIQLAIFSMVKCRITAAGNLSELEEELIYLNLLIDNNFKVALEYKYRLFNSLIKTGILDERVMMVVRHLVNYRVAIIDDLVDYLAKRLGLNERQSELIKVKVYIIEGEYKKAFRSIKINDIDSFGEYSSLLKNYSPGKYQRKVKKCHQYKNKLLKFSR